MKILVLGATGQIGYALTRALSQTEHQVSVLVRDASGHRFPDAVTVVAHGEFTPDVFRTSLSGVDHVIYGVGLPEQFLFDNSIFERVNCGLLKTFLEALRSSGVRRLTYISTYEVFEAIAGAIDETHPIADESSMTPYFQSMVRAYRIAVDFCVANEIRLTTIHPAAVYGGLNTGGGITDYMKNLAARNWVRVPFISETSFPVVHVDALADAIIKSLDRPGAYIVSDGMTTLRDIARTMRGQVPSYVPMTVPMWLISPGISVLEAIARVSGTKPFASAVQLEFLTKGWKPDPGKAKRELGWKPMTLEEGVRRVLSQPASSSGETQARGGAHLARTGLGLSRAIARLELMTAVGLLLYWLLYFTVGLAPENPPPGYFVFQNSFTASDIILALVLFRAGTYLLGEDAARRVAGRRLSLVCAGALIFLGGLDISFNFQNGIYENLSIDLALEIAINAWCLGFGLLVVLTFGRMRGL